MTDTSRKISTLVNSQVPEFVRDQNPLFVNFLEAYYEYLEQSDDSVVEGKLIDRAENFRDLIDIDQTLPIFADNLYSKFLALLPTNMPANQAMILKNIKDFYRARGSEKSYRFLFRALFGEDIEIYYPKENILIASSGKWLIEKSVHVTNLLVNSVPVTDLENFQLFTNTRIAGQTSGATGVVERVLISYQSGALVYELFLSGQIGEFQGGETITTTDVNGNLLEATLVSGFISQVTLTNGGSKYNIGDQAVITSNSGSGAVIYVAATTTGNVDGVQPLDGGAGFRVGDPVIFTGGGGTGALGTVASLIGTANSFYHANNYAICSDVISTYQNVALNGAYGFPADPTSNANTTMNTALTFWDYGITGPIGSIAMTQNGSGYITTPTADVVGNVSIKILGILGRMNVVSAGINYLAGEQLTFNNPPLGFGSGAKANIISVAANGAIQLVQFVPFAGWPPGGTGYDQNHLPTVSIATASGTGANVVVTALLGYGDPETSFEVTTGSIGTITALTIGDSGSGFLDTPNVSFATTGDGTAQAFANVVTGTFTYPGRYTDETGFLSSYNFLEDQDYYQNYSYVIKVKQSIDQYRKYVRNLVHPAGMKLWGQYQQINDVPAMVSINTHASVIVLTT